MEEKREIQPACIGFIMDGNRRWARVHGKSETEGHRFGYDAFRVIVEALTKRGIEHGVFYAFSTENWHRTKEEVEFLLKLFEQMIRTLLEEESVRLSVRVRFIGERSRFSETLQTLMNSVEEKTENVVGTTVWIALSYGGRAELVDAVNRAVQEGVVVTEESFGSLLWTCDMPDPDLIIRTGGEERLSNFLPWQSVYSEFMFTKTFWPDFGEMEFQRMLEAYGNRIRRKGT